MLIAVIDGQGGRVGALVIDSLRKAGLAAPHTILALGTNSLATSAMLKAGADHAATGENPVIVAGRKADLIIGPIGMLMADALYGEITAAMAAAIGRSDAVKLAMPVSRCSCVIPGTEGLTIPEIVRLTVEETLRICAGGAEAVHC